MPASCLSQPSSIAACGVLLSQDSPTAWQAILNGDPIVSTVRSGHGRQSMTAWVTPVVLLAFAEIPTWTTLAIVFQGYETLHVQGVAGEPSRIDELFRSSVRSGLGRQSMTAWLTPVVLFGVCKGTTTSCRPGRCRGGFRLSVPLASSAASACFMPRRPAASKNA